VCTFLRFYRFLLYLRIWNWILITGYRFDSVPHLSTVTAWINIFGYLRLIDLKISSYRCLYPDWHSVEMICMLICGLSTMWTTSFQICILLLDHRLISHSDCLDIHWRNLNIFWIYEYSRLSSPIGEVLEKGLVRGTRNRRACMRNLMTVEAAKRVYKDR
jgi:hypothetical protein